MLTMVFLQRAQATPQKAQTAIVVEELFENCTIAAHNNEFWDDTLWVYKDTRSAQKREINLNLTSEALDLLSSESLQAHFPGWDRTDRWQKSVGHMMFVLSPQTWQRILSAVEKGPIFEAFSEKDLHEVPRPKGVWIVRNPSQTDQFFLFFIAPDTKQLRKIVQDVRKRKLTHELIYTPKA